MNTNISAEDVVKVINSFIEINEGDEATTYLILSIGAELLDVPLDTMEEMAYGLITD